MTSNSTWSQGLPGAPCPDNHCDKSVKYGLYDLFLCPACENTRDTEQQSGVKQASEDPKEPADRTDELVEVAQASSVSNLSSEGFSQLSTASATSSSALQSAATSASGEDLPSLSVSATDPSLHVPTKLVVSHLSTYASFYRSRSTENNSSKAKMGFHSAIEISD